MPPRVSKGKGERGGTASQGGKPSISPTTDPMLKLEILQCNTNRSQSSMGLLEEMGAETGVDVLCVSLNLTKRWYRKVAG
jgi:hypothetical protein